MAGLDLTKSLPGVLEMSIISDLAIVETAVLLLDTFEPSNGGLGLCLCAAFSSLDPWCLCNRAAGAAARRRIGETR